MASTTSVTVVALTLVAGCSSCRSEEALPTPVVSPRVAIYDDPCMGTPPQATCQHPSVQAQCTDGWCSIPKGCFLMGSPECEWGRGRNSENENETTLTHDFLMQQTEVTQAEWTSVGLTNPSKTSDAPRLDCADPTCPVGNVNWYEALEFANRLSTSKGKRACYALEGCSGEPGTGMTCSGARAVNPSVYDCEGYRLPTEAEWEYAARAGSRWATYAGDLRAQRETSACARDVVLDPIAWYCTNAGNTTHPVKRLEPNDWGLFDMAGNVAEWTSDRFDGAGYGVSARVNPGAQVGADVTMAVRGGFAHGFQVLARSAYRDQAGPTQRDAGFGFRLVRTSK